MEKEERAEATVLIVAPTNVDPFTRPLLRLFLGCNQHSPQKKNKKKLKRERTKGVLKTDQRVMYSEIS